MSGEGENKKGTGTGVSVTTESESITLIDPYVRKTSQSQEGKDESEVKNDEVMIYYFPTSYSSQKVSPFSVK